MSTVIPDALSYERIKQARETLTAAAQQIRNDGFPGAIEAVDPWGTFIEAKRNLTALVAHVHGEEAWERMLDE